MLRILLFSVHWKPEGCFKEKLRRKALLKKRFKTVKGITDIGRIFEACKAIAEKKGFEFFAIKVRSHNLCSK